MRDRTVYIYNCHQEVKGEHSNRPLAYSAYHTSRACVHVVKADSRAESFKLALAQHKMCDQSDKYCSQCRAQEKEK